MYSILVSAARLPTVYKGYRLEKKIVNSDFFISEIRNAIEIVIGQREKVFLLLFKSKDDDIVYEIPLENIKETEVSYQRLGRFSKKDDKLIQIVFTDEDLRLRTIRVNVEDSQIEDLLDQIRKLKPDHPSNVNQIDNKYCSRCGSTNTPDSKFCSNCGHKLQMLCSNCNNINPESSHFCPKCSLQLNNNKDQRA